MRSKSLLGLVVLYPLVLWSADNIQPLDVKLGLWETSVTSAVSGLPPLPPEMLAKLTPEQRAQFEQVYKAGSAKGAKPTTHRSCLTKEKLQKSLAFGEERKECTRTVLSSSGRKLEARMECTEQNVKMNGTLRVEAVNSENVMGSMEMTSSGGGQAMNVNSTFVSKWLGAACGDVK